MKRCTLSKNRQRTPLSPFLFQLLSFSFGLLVAEGAYLYNISSLTVSNKTSSSVYLTWNEPHGSSSFFIVNWTGDSVNNSSNTSNTSYTVTGLTAGVNYIFTVTAVAADNQTTGAPAQTSAFTKPDFPRDLRVTEITTSSLFLNWTQPVGERYFFNVQWSNDNKTLNSTTTNTFFNITDLNPGVNYTILISAVAADNITEGEAISLSVYTKPDSVKNLISSEVTSRSMVLRWDVPSGEWSFFRVQWMNNNTRSYITNISITDLEPGTNYTFAVSAVAADNKTEGSLVKVSTCTGASPVIDIICKGPNRSSTALLNLTWQNPPGNNEGFNISLRPTISLSPTISDFIPQCKNVCNHIFSKNLQYFTTYSLVISTLGCGDSGTWNFNCTIGITEPSSTANTVPIVLGVVLPIICLFIMVIIIVIVRRLQIHHSPNQNEMKVPTESSDLQATYMNLAHVQRPAVDSATNSNIMEIVNSKL
ncbi:receptor-type tyrosine-protein phosphatase eta-like [Hemibagrus wyckioides]|uniref:receptor-type tyrosine-protein phosphatase eta-like n=1 Tax=Hemibagrus wyckioides TaxID=337641 RepID=UPI00266BF43C|nr:receptor-type tyrosine-protein phosphatase eta-like [Hemibagrus wyckioides]